MSRGTAGGWRWACAFGAAIAAALALAAPALALNFSGETSQGKDFNLRTDDAGVAERADYGWDQDCSGGGTLSNGGTVSRFRGRSANEFGSAGAYEATIETTFDGVFKARIKGERVSDTRFKGSFKVKTKVFKKRSGELVTKCSTGIVRFTADLQGPTPRAPTAPGRTATALNLR